MDQFHPIASSDTSPQAGGLTIDLMVGDEGAVASLQRLRSAVAEIAECLQRAEAILETVAQPATRAPAPAPAPAPQGLAPWQVRRVLTYVDSNLHMPIRNKDLATVARLSEFHFNVAFRKSVGHSPHEYIIRRRMERAQGLMLSTNKPLSEIAVECGLADQPHFTRLFRRFVGESPAAWRRARANPGG